MANGQIVAGWLNAANTNVTMGGYVSNARVMPQHTANLFATLAPLDVPAPAWAKIAFSVTMLKSNTYGVPINGAMDYIYAYGEGAPTIRDSTTSPIPLHDFMGGFNLDFSVQGAMTTLAPRKPKDGLTGALTSNYHLGFLALPPGVTFEQVVNNHAAIMLTAWGVFPWVGIFIAKYMKRYLDVWWYRLHMFVMLFLVVGLGNAGIIYLYLYKGRLCPFIRVYDFN